MARFGFTELMGSVFSAFGAGTAISVISAASSGASVSLSSAITNPITGFFVALGFGVGFALEYRAYGKALDKEKAADNAEEKAAAAK